MQTKKSKLAVAKIVGKMIHKVERYYTQRDSFSFIDLLPMYILIWDENGGGYVVTPFRLKFFGIYY